MHADSSYSLPELSGLAGVTPRTVRYYISQGLLPSPATTGPGAQYTETHLNRLQLVKQMQRRHLPLAEIRNRLAALSDDQVASALAQKPDPPAGTAFDYVRSVLASKGGGATAPLLRVAESAQSLASPRVEASQPDRSSWDRIALTPDIELHVRRPLSRPDNRLVSRLIDFARKLLQENQP
ncbi:MAG: MerR family transcriptional regulator [Gemmatimonadota bacterium]